MFVEKLAEKATKKSVVSIDVSSLRSGGFENIDDRNVTASVDTKFFLDTIYLQSGTHENMKLGRRHQALVNIKHKDNAIPDPKGPDYHNGEVVTNSWNGIRLRPVNFAGLLFSWSRERRR